MASQWWETCKCQQCYLAFLEQENGPADTSWILAKHVGGHVVNLLVAAVAKKPSSHVGTVAGGRERAHVEIRLLTQILLFACRKRGIFASRDLGTRWNLPTFISEAVSDKHVVKGSNSSANYHENNRTHRKFGIGNIRKPRLCGLTRRKIDSFYRVCWLV